MNWRRYSALAFSVIDSLDGSPAGEGPVNCEFIFRIRVTMPAMYHARYMPSNVKCGKELAGDTDGDGVSDFAGKSGKSKGSGVFDFLIAAD